MKTLSLRIIVLLISFALGVTSVILVSRFYDRQTATIPARETPITSAPDLVAALRNTEPIFTDQFKKDSNDDKTWRWLKEEIARYQNSPEYVQRSLSLPLDDNYRYQISFEEITGDNFKPELQYWRSQGVQLRPDHRYAWFWVSVDNVVCPSWSGVIDMTDPGLIFFDGGGA